MSSPRLSTAAELTRRQWTTLMAASPLLAQVPVTAPPESASKVSPTDTPATPELQLIKAIADVRSVSEKLSKIQVPMGVEPAFAFKV